MQDQSQRLVAHITEAIRRTERVLTHDIEEGFPIHAAEVHDQLTALRSQRRRIVCNLAGAILLTITAAILGTALGLVIYARI